MKKAEENMDDSKRSVAYPTSELKPDALYRLLSGLVLPRPIALVSTVSEAGVPNLAPFSFFTVASADPPVVTISVDLRFGHQLKDTMRNIAATGEFVVNIVSEDLGRAVNVSSLDWAPDEDEFGPSGVTAVWDNIAVRAPRVAESPAQFECKHLQSIPFGKTAKWTLVLGEVVAFRCRQDLVDPRLRVSLDALRPIGRLSGNDYCHVRDRFTIARDADSPGLLSPLEQEKLLKRDASAGGKAR
jgi:flavin reductase (DIM6/NTAB) family NADH-FMN oxidoreductase RutF